MKMNGINSFEDSSMQNMDVLRAESLIQPPDEQDDIMATEEQNVPIVIPVSSVSTRLTNLCAVIKDMKVELVMFLYAFSYIVRSVSATSMILDKVCLVHLSYPQSVCQNMSHYPSIKVAAEKMANNYHLGHSLVQLVPSAIMALFVGAWSDRYGRKPPVIVALIGIILDGFGSTLCAALLNSRVEYYFIPALFTGLSSGVVGVLTVLYSYVSDATTAENRTMKYTVLEVCFGLALPLGGLLGGWVYRYSGYVLVFMISTSGHIIALILVIFILKETRGLDNKDSWKQKLRNFWSTDAVVESFRTTVKWRPNKGREQILLLIMAISIGIFNNSTSASIGFMYVHHMYDWDNTKYSTVHSVFSVIGTIVLLVSVPVFKRLKLGDAALGIAGSISLLLKSVGLGLATTEYIYYLANLLSIFSALETLAGRSRISKVAPSNDLGKVFSFLSATETLLPIVTSAVITLVFNETLEFFPGLIFILLGALMLNPLVVFLWLRRIPAESEQNDFPVGNIQDPTSLCRGQEISQKKESQDSKDESTVESKPPFKY